MMVYANKLYAKNNNNKKDHKNIICCTPCLYFFPCIFSGGLEIETQDGTQGQSARLRTEQSVIRRKWTRKASPVLLCSVTLIFIIH